MGKKIMVTEALLENCRTYKGGFDRRTIEMLGFNWPPQKGWKKSLVGREIDIDILQLIFYRKDTTKWNASLEDFIPVDIIEYPIAPSEFEIQSYIYCELKNHNIDVRGEIRTSLGQAKFDLVIFAKQTAQFIIEVKKYPHDFFPEHLSKEYISNEKVQIRKYKRYGLPVKAIHGMDEAQKFVSDILGLKNETKNG